MSSDFQKHQFYLYLRNYIVISTDNVNEVLSTVLGVYMYTHILQQQYNSYAV